MDEMQKHVEFRIMPCGNDQQWYWEVIYEDHSIVSRGLAETQGAAHKEATDAARKANLIQ
jgi:hypothetical protein